MADDRKRTADAAKTPDEIRADIEATREQLGDTVEALAAKTDVKARAHDRVEEIKTDARAKAEEVKAKVKDATAGGASGSSDPGAPSTGEQVAAGANQAVETARANPLPVAVGAALLLGFLIGRRRGRRRG